MELSTERKVLIPVEGLYVYIRLLPECDVKTYQVEMEANWTEQFSSPQCLILISTLPSVKTANQPDLIQVKLICIFICSFREKVC